MEDNELLEARLEEIEHMLFHALSEESVSEALGQARSQAEVYEILKALPYFTLTVEEFRTGILSLSQRASEA